MSVRLQELLHKYEVGAGAGVMRFVAAAIAIVAAAVIFDLCAFRNLATPEAMDMAQVARNVSRGDGFTTGFIRPLSLYLVSKNRGGDPGATPAPLAAKHPDLAHPPIYPGLLGLALKSSPFQERDLSRQQNFSIFPADLWIAIFNQLLLALAAWMVFLLARALFDAPLAWACFVVFLLSEAYWRFSVSGLATILLIIEFLALVWAVAKIESAARQSPASQSSLIGFAALAGLLTAAMAMTRYSFACLIIPLVILLGTIPSKKRPLLVIVALAVFLGACAPWMIRNYQLCGTPFGTAGFAVMAGTSKFPEDQLERSLHPAFGQIETGEYWEKLINNLHGLVAADLWQLGTGGWLAALFFASLLVPFRSALLQRLRLFLVLSIGVLIVAQALGRTTIWTESPEINSENLLIIVAPATLMFGLSLFLLLRDQLNLQGPTGRGIIWFVFYLIAGAPLLLSVFGRHPSPVVFPPYYPPWIQEKAHAVPAEGVIMSDVPWAVAWYGGRPSIWLSLKYIDRVSPNLREDFAAVDRMVPLKGLYLTGKTLKAMDVKALGAWSQARAEDPDLQLVQKMVTEVGQEMIRANVKQEMVDKLRQVYAVVDKNWVRGGGDDWDSFVLGIFVKKEVPTGFRLQQAVGGILPEIFLTELNERPIQKAIQ